MSKNSPGLMKLIIDLLLRMNTIQFIILFLVVAVVISVMIVLTTDLLWDGRLNAELEFAGVLTPFLDGLLLVIFIVGMLNQIRGEVRLRREAEDKVRKLNEELEVKVKERTQQLLDAQDELIRKEKLATLGQIAGSVGHELRNPLGVMSNAVYFLKTVLADADDTTKEYLEIIQDEIAGAERIVSDLLDSVRTKPPQPQFIRPAELIQTSLSKCKIPDNIKVNIQAETQLPLKIDPMQITQVFINLIKNAADAMPAGGVLKIEAEEDRENKSIKLIFKDSGVGIAPENIPKLFNPLYTTKARGIGLGLVVVKNLTKANGGTVEVTSEVGKGTTFTLLFPMADERADQDNSGRKP